MSMVPNENETSTNALFNRVWEAGAASLGSVGQIPARNGHNDDCVPARALRPARRGAANCISAIPYESSPPSNRTPDESA